MLKSVSLAFLFFSFSFLSGAQSVNISDYIAINLSAYQLNGETHYAPMPGIKSNAQLSNYSWRFEFLLMNIPDIHRAESVSKRQQLFDLNDSSTMKQSYLNELQNDPYFMKAFTETVKPFVQPNYKPDLTFTKEEMMKVAAVFFYCDSVNPDTTVQTHVCIGINGFNEVNWEKDYAVLAAFCCEAVLFDVFQYNSPVNEALSAEKQLSYKVWREKITTSEDYLKTIRKDVYKRMENNAVLKKTLLNYYKRNKSNLAFRIQ